jgi:hypothetical protein
MTSGVITFKIVDGPTIQQLATAWELFDQDDHSTTADDGLQFVEFSGELTQNDQQDSKRFEVKIRGVKHTDNSRIISVTAVFPGGLLTGELTFEYNLADQTGEIVVNAEN